MSISIKETLDEGKPLVILKTFRGNIKIAPLAALNRGQRIRKGAKRKFRYGFLSYESKDYELYGITIYSEQHEVSPLKPTIKFLVEPFAEQYTALLKEQRELRKREGILLAEAYRKSTKPVYERDVDKIVEERKLRNQ